MPLLIARDPLPSGVRGWGRPYQQQLRRWEHVAAVRIQPDLLAYAPTTSILIRATGTAEVSGYRCCGSPRR